MVAAPADHWIHEYHEFGTLKEPSNPYMGRFYLVLPMCNTCCHS